MSIDCGYHKFVICAWMAIALPKEDKLGCRIFTVMREATVMIKIRNKITIILLKKAMMDLWSCVAVWVKERVKKKVGKRGMER